MYLLLAYSIECKSREYYILPFEPPNAIVWGPIYCTGVRGSGAEDTAPWGCDVRTRRRGMWQGDTVSSGVVRRTRCTGMRHEYTVSGDTARGYGVIRGSARDFFFLKTASTTPTTLRRYVFDRGPHRHSDNIFFYIQQDICFHLPFVPCILRGLTNGGPGRYRFLLRVKF